MHSILCCYLLGCAKWWSRSREVSDIAIWYKFILIGCFIILINRDVNSASWRYLKDIRYILCCTYLLTHLKGVVTSVYSIASPEPPALWRCDVGAITVCLVIQTSTLLAVKRTIRGLNTTTTVNSCLFLTLTVNFSLRLDSEIVIVSSGTNLFHVFSLPPPVQISHHVVILQYARARQYRRIH